MKHSRIVASLSLILNAAVSLALSALGPPPTFAYMHIPFCRRRCFYCDFPIEVVGDKGPNSNTAEAYVSLLKREIAATARTMLCDDAEIRANGAQSLGETVATAGGLETLYIGGGTPSLLAPTLLADLLDAVKLHYGGFAPGCEITLEMDPGTFDCARLQEFLSCGVNRVSLGVQSWDPHELKAAGRAHCIEDAEAACVLLANACAEGSLHSWSLDLISGLPHATAESWQRTLDRSVQGDESNAWKPPHVSVYDLQVEPGTAFGKWYAPGLFPLAPEDDVANFYRQASASLGAAGYEHYELSSYALLTSDENHERQNAHAGVATTSEAVPATARRGEAARAEDAASTESKAVKPSPPQGGKSWVKSPHRSRHNTCYWAMRPFLGFGLGASSMVANGARVARPRDAPGYADFVATLEDGCGGGGGELNSNLETGEPTAENNIPRNSKRDRNEYGDSREGIRGSSRSKQRSAARALLLGDTYSSLNSNEVSHDDDSSNSSRENAAQYEALLEGLMVALRTSDGFDLDQCAANFGDGVTDAIVTAAQDAQAQGLAEIVRGRNIAAAKTVPEVSRDEASAHWSSDVSDVEDRSRGILRLTDPEGFLFSNQVISTLFAVLEPEML